MSCALLKHLHPALSSHLRVCSCFCLQGCSCVSHEPPVRMMEKVLFHHFPMFFIVFDHAIACASMRLLVKIHNMGVNWPFNQDLPFALPLRNLLIRLEANCWETIFVSLQEMYERIDICLVLESWAKTHYSLIYSVGNWCHGEWCKAHTLTVQG